MSFNTAQLFRRFENLIRIGTIADVDYQGKRLRVKSGELLTDWLPWPAEIGRNFTRWRPLRTHTQVVLVCPSGDPAQALVIATLYSNQLDSPSTDPLIDVVQFNDGTSLEYNSNTNTLNISTAGDVYVTAKGNAKTDAASIALNNGNPVVTTGHICSFTGKPHGDGSSTVKAGL